MCSNQKTQTHLMSQIRRSLVLKLFLPKDWLKSKNGKMFWSSVPHYIHNRAATANVIKMAPGITRFAVTRVSDVRKQKLFLD